MAQVHYCLYLIVRFFLALPSKIVEKLLVALLKALPQDQLGIIK